MLWKKYNSGNDKILNELKKDNSELKKDNSELKKDNHSFKRDKKIVSLRLLLQDLNAMFKLEIIYTKAKKPFYANILANYRETRNDISHFMKLPDTLVFHNSKSFKNYKNKRNDIIIRNNKNYKSIQLANSILDTEGQLCAKLIIINKFFEEINANEYSDYFDPRLINEIKSFFKNKKIFNFDELNEMKNKMSEDEKQNLKYQFNYFFKNLADFPFPL